MPRCELRREGDARQQDVFCNTVFVGNRDVIAVW